MLCGNLYDLDQRYSSFEQRSASAKFIADSLSAFLRVQERVMICLPDIAESALAQLFTTAVTVAGGVPILWSSDLHWRSLLRQAFQNRCTTIIGMPQIILGLTKLSRATGTPLYIRNVVLYGDATEDWLIDGIRKKLDCHIWGCFIPRGTACVAGFSKPDQYGIYVRHPVFDVEILDSAGNSVDADTIGDVVLIQRETKSCFATGERAIWRKPGYKTGEAPFIPLADDAGDMAQLRKEFLSWTSVLDFSGSYSQYGLCLELNVFPGESLPKLPSCARLSIHRWDPENDRPYSVVF